MNIKPIGERVLLKPIKKEEKLRVVYYLVQNHLIQIHKIKQKLLLWGKVKS